MSNILQYAKTIAAALGAILTSVVAVLPEAPLWLTIALAISTAVAVFVIPNDITDKQIEELHDELVS